MNYILDRQQSDRLLFRRLTWEDYPVWIEFFKDPASTAHWTPTDPDPDVQCMKWFEKIFWRYENNKGGMNVLIDKRTGAFVGQCGLLIQTVGEEEELEVGYSIMPAFRNKGYATEAAWRCIAYAFSNNLRRSLISIIHENNLGSEKVALKNSMTMDKSVSYGGNPVKIYRITQKKFYQFEEDLHGARPLR